MRAREIDGMAMIPVCIINKWLRSGRLKSSFWKRPKINRIN
jgi:hypothetical protein